MNAALAADRQHYGLTLAVLLAATLTFALQQTMVAPALPAIQAELSTSTTAVSFVLTGFLITASVSTPIVGRLGDMFGKERILVAAMAVFALGSIVCALSASIEVLIAGRAIQGCAAGVFPLAFGIIRDEFPPERIAAALGLISASFGIGGGAGLILSGVIVENFNYEAIFWFASIFIVLATIAVVIWVPESPVKSPARIDWGGAALLGGALVALLVAVSEANSWGWGSPEIIGLFALAALLITTWIRFESRHPQPLVDMRMLRDRGVMTTNLTAMLTGFGMFGSFILLPQLAQLPETTGFGFGENVIGAGLFMAPSAVAMLVGGPLAGVLAGRFGSRLPLVAGSAIASLSFVVLALLHADRVWVYVSSGILGLGIGLSFASMANLVVQAVHPTRTGVATGINTIMRTVGGSLGGQIAAAIVAGHVVAATGLPKELGFELAFLMSAAAMALAVLAALAIPKRLPFAPGAEQPTPTDASPALAAGRG